MFGVCEQKCHRPASVALGENQYVSARKHSIARHRRQIAWPRQLARIVGCRRLRTGCRLLRPGWLTGLAQPYPVCRSLDGGHVVRARLFPVLVVAACARSMQALVGELPIEMEDAGVCLLQHAVHRSRAWFAVRARCVALDRRSPSQLWLVKAERRLAMGVRAA